MTIKAEYKIIADHLRSCCFLIAEGVMPSNEGRGYVLRRIMRRAMLQIHKLGAKKMAMYKLVPALIKEMGTAYPELKAANDLMVDTLKNEEEKFQSTLEIGLKILEEEIAKDPKSEEFSGAIAFKLYDTYGFPLDLTADILKQYQKKVRVAEFDLEMEKQKKRAKENWVGSGEEKEDEFYLGLKNKYQETEFLGYETTYANARILTIIKDKKEISSTNINDRNIAIILDKTPFYGTSGGQKGDDGNLILASEVKANQLIEYQKLPTVADVIEAKKLAGNLLLHLISEVKGQFKVGDEVVAIVNNRNRQFRAQNHSATHLLHKALKELLGNQITQKGSNVDATYLTFDFNFNRALTEEELDTIEDLVNFYIRQNSEVKTSIMSLDEAKNQGAMALFGEKYSTQVRVLSMGKTCNQQDWSKELCGGTHVKNTGNIGLFKIISEKGIASGIRRIEARTGYFALEFLRLSQKKLRSLIQSLKINQVADEVINLGSEFYNSKTGFDDTSYFLEESQSKITNETQNQLLKAIVLNAAKIGEEKIAEIKSKNKEIETLKKQILLSKLDNLDLKKIADDKGRKLDLVSFSFQDLNPQELNEVILDLKNKSQYQQNTVIILFSTQNSRIAAAITVSLNLIEAENSAHNALELAKFISGKIGGKTGGKKDFAVINGAGKLPDAADLATEVKYFFFK